MAWMITCDDSTKGASLRADKALMAAHWAYELSIKHHILAAGSLRSDDGQTPKGSLLVLTCATRAEAVALFEADPATKSGLRDNIRITFWNPAILNGIVQP